MQNLSKMAKLVLILLTVMVASFIIAGLIFFSEYGSNLSIFNSVKPKNAVSVDVEKTADIASVKSIYVETTSDDVNFLVSDTNEVKAHYHGYYSSSSKDFRPELTVTASGGDLMIKIVYKPNMNVMMFNSNLKLDVYLPASYSDKLEVNTTSAGIKIDTLNKLTSFTSASTSGDLEAKRVNADTADVRSTSGRINISGTYGSFTCKTASGDIKTNGIIAKTATFSSTSGQIKGNVSADDLQLGTTSGDIAVDPASSKVCNASTSSGTITLNGDPGNVTASSTSGDINLSYDKFGNDINVTTFSGSTKINLPQNSEFKLDYSTMSGSGRCDFPVTISGSQGRNNITGTVVSDKNTVKVSSTSGDLVIGKR